jgi:hypothetical protein
MLEALTRHPIRHRNHVKIAVLMRQSTLDSAAPVKRKTVQRIRALGVHLEGGDVTIVSTEALAAMFKHYDTVISCTGMGLPPGTQEKLAEAALLGQVSRYFPWQFGMDYDVIGHGSSQDLFDEQLEVRQRLRGQNQTRWTIVSTGLFMSFLFVPEFGVVDLEQRVVRALGGWDNAITLTTPEDIGRVTADLVLDPRELAEGSQVVYTAGETITYGALADLLDQHFDAKFQRELWSLDELRRQMEEDPDNGMVKYRDTFAQGKGVSWEVSGTANHDRGIPMTDLKAYLEALRVMADAETE